jgi:hypothetical protein
MLSEQLHMVCDIHMCGERGRNTMACSETKESESKATRKVKRRNDKGSNSSIFRDRLGGFMVGDEINK